MGAISVVGYVSRDFGIEQEILFFSTVFWVLNLDHSSKVLFGAISVVGYVSRDFEIEQEILFFFAVFWVSILDHSSKVIFWGYISSGNVSKDFFSFQGFFFFSLLSSKQNVRYVQVMVRSWSFSFFFFLPIFFSSFGVSADSKSVNIIIVTHFFHIEVDFTSIKN